jgi:copper chaperone CopZ
MAFRPQERPLIALEISDMTCGRSVGAVTGAVKSVDRGAKIRIDRTTRRVDIEPNRAGASELVDAIAKAGFRPVLIADSALTAFPWSESCGQALARAMMATAMHDETAIARPPS